MVVAPLVSGETVFGALGAFSSKTDAFSPSAIGLVRALADHAAASMSNARLIEALDASRGELAERADVERSLREIAARISAATDLPGGPPARRRRGSPPAPRRRCADRPDRPDPRPPALGLRVRRDPAQRRGMARRPRRDARPGHLRQGGRQRPGVLVGRLRQRHALLARPGRGPVRQRVRAAFGDGGAAHRRGRRDRRADRLQQPRRCLGREGRRPARGDRRPGGHHDPDHPPDRRARPLARGARPAGGGGAGAARDRRADHDPARAGGDPPGRRRPGRAPGPGRRGDPRPPRPGDRQPPLGLRRRPVRHLQCRGAGPAVDLGRGRRHRDGGRRGPGHRRRRRPRVATSRRRPNRPSSTSAPGSTR